MKITFDAWIDPNTGKVALTTGPDQGNLILEPKPGRPTDRLTAMVRAAEGAARE